MPQLQILIIGKSYCQERSPGVLLIHYIGANRGIGFELAKRLKEHGHHVFGTYRPSSRDDPSVQRLLSLSIPTLEADYSAEPGLSTLPHLYTTHPQGSPHLDVLINCGGIYFPLDTVPFHAFTAADILEHFRVNTLGPFLTAKYLYPLLTRSPWGGRIVNVSSDFASIADNTGGNVAYRLSKAALNQLTATMAAEGSRPWLFDVRQEWGGGAGGGAADPVVLNAGGGGKTLTAISVHPGFVPTTMTGYQGRDDLGKSVEGIVKLVERLCEEGGRSQDKRRRGKGEEELEAGGFYRWDGVRMAL